MRLNLLLASAALATVAICAPATQTRAQHAVPADLQREAAAILESAYKANEPGAAAIVMRGGQVIWAGGRGLADLESGRTITPQTVFRTGSITKQFVAAPGWSSA